MTQNNPVEEKVTSLTVASVAPVKKVKAVVDPKISGYKVESIPLQKLAAKVYNLPAGLSEEMLASIGEIEDCWDCCIHGGSGNGKTNFANKLIMDLVIALDCKAEYVSWEEGHGKSIQDTMIKRQNLLALIGNKMAITKGLPFEVLVHRMKKKQSAKIWVLDSIQASGLTKEQIIELRETFILGKSKRKIIIFISWGKNGAPIGAAGGAAEFNANIKVLVEGFIAFPKSRFGGNKPYVIWEGDATEGAIRYWDKRYWKLTGKQKPIKPRKKKESPASTIHPSQQNNNEENLSNDTSTKNTDH
jgi:hypothetical protein